MLALAALGAAAGPAAAQSDPANDEAGAIVAGIVHYTRWPDPPAVLRLCIDARDELASGAGARRLADAFAGFEPRAMTIEGRRLDAANLADCHVLYIGEAPATAWRELLKGLVNRPVLTIGRGEDFCSWGGQFCLEPLAGELRIRANLDAIARSGLRVNPQLLRLTQRDPKAVR